MTALNSGGTGEGGCPNIEACAGAGTVQRI